MTPSDVTATYTWRVAQEDGMQSRLERTQLQLTNDAAEDDDGAIVAAIAAAVALLLAAAVVVAAAAADAGFAPTLHRLAAFCLLLWLMLPYCRLFCPS